MVRVGVYPVIHYRDLDQAWRNARAAMLAGCPGVFLINMSGSHHELTGACRTLRQQLHNPDFVLGTNRLGLAAPEHYALELSLGAGQAVWTDQSGLHSHYRQSEAVDGVKRQPSGVTYFAAVAFKTQRAEPNPQPLIAEAVEAGWIPTTSGPGTGHPADPERVHAMGEYAHALGGRLALASGITPENATRYKGAVDYWLVATGISRTFYDLDDAKLDRLLGALA